MSYKEKSAAQEEIFEIIELAIDDLETLTRAFEVIGNVCEELQAPNMLVDVLPEKELVH